MMRAAIAAAVSGIATGTVLATCTLLASAHGAVSYAASAVAIDNFTFGPQDLTVKARTTVTWTNKDDIPHTVAAVGKLFRSKALDTNDNYSFTFMTPGTYAYFCSLHPHMTGTIVVEAAPGDDAGH